MKSYFCLTLLLLCTATSIFGQEIFELLDNKDHSTLQQKLEDGMDTEQVNDNGLTPLWMAVYKNDTTSVKLLLNNGASLDYPVEKGMHPIMVGCIANSMESVKILLDKGVDVNWKSKASRNQQPIRFASQEGSLDLVKMLLHYGADMEATPDDKGTPLLAALHARNFEVAEYYFLNGANVSVVGRDGECVVHEAIKTNNPYMVKLALDRNAPLNYLDPKGKTTWQLAKKTGNPEIKTLIKQALDK
nr:ankyrin repeat domain-containing protein [Allomuricauda sp.]